LCHLFESAVRADGEDTNRSYLAVQRYRNLRSPLMVISRFAPPAGLDPPITPRSASACRRCQS
jgi:hypothetical protein